MSVRIIGYKTERSKRTFRREIFLTACESVAFNSTLSWLKLNPFKITFTQLSILIKKYFKNKPQNNIYILSRLSIIYGTFIKRVTNRVTDYFARETGLCSHTKLASPDPLSLLLLHPILSLSRHKFLSTLYL